MWTQATVVAPVFAGKGEAAPAGFNADARMLNPARGRWATTPGTPASSRTTRRGGAGRDGVAMARVTARDGSIVLNTTSRFYCFLVKSLHRMGTHVVRHAVETASPRRPPRPSSPTFAPARAALPPRTPRRPSPPPSGSSTGRRVPQRGRHRVRGSAAHRAGHRGRLLIRRGRRRGESRFGFSATRATARAGSVAASATPRWRRPRWRLPRGDGGARHGRGRRSSPRLINPFPTSP